MAAMTNLVGNPEMKTPSARRHVGARENIRWRSKTHAAVEAAASEGGSAAEVPDLLIAPSAPARNPAQGMGSGAG